MRIAAGVALALFLALFPIHACAQEPPPPPHPEDGDDRPFPNLTITARVEERRDAASGDMVRKIIANGESQYPEGASLVLEAQLKGLGGYLDKKHKVFVGPDGRWEGKIDELGRNVYTGDYSVRVTFDPAHQTRTAMDKLKGTLNDRMQFSIFDVHIGTAEEGAREKENIDQFYARVFAKARGYCERIFAEYEKQSKEPDRRSWGDFMTDIGSDINDADRELADFRKSKDKLRDFATYERLSRIYALTGTMLFPTLSSALGIEGGKGTPKEKQEAQILLDDLKGCVGELDAVLGKVKIDPKWKMPSPIPVRLGGDAVVAPIPPIDHFVPPPSVPSGPEGRKFVPRTKFGVAELGIGFAIMCGIAMLVVLLRKK